MRTFNFRASPATFLLLFELDSFKQTGKSHILCLHLRISVRMVETGPAIRSIFIKTLSFVR